MDGYTEIMLDQRRVTRLNYLRMETVFYAYHMNGATALPIVNIDQVYLKNYERVKKMLIL